MDILKKSQIIQFSVWICIIGFLIECSNNTNNSVKSFILPEGSECIEIINADSISLDVPYVFRALYDNHPSLILDRYLTVLDDTLSSPFLLPFDFPFSDIHWNDGQCFIASDSTIFYGDNKGIVYPLVESDDRIRSFSVTDERILYPCDSLLLEYRFGAEQINCIINAHNRISKVVDLLSSIFYASENDLFLVYENSSYRLYDAEEKIYSFEVHPTGGVFVGTQSGLTFINPDYKKIIIIDEPVLDLQLIGDDLYVIFSNNGSVAITDVSNYQSVSDIIIE